MPKLKEFRVDCWGDYAMRKIAGGRSIEGLKDRRKKRKEERIRKKKNRK